MKSRFFMILLGALLMPTAGQAIVPTADVPGTTQAATEVGNTANNVQESATQVSQYQKTMAAMGTAKKSVSDYVTKQKEKLQKKMEKIQKYKEKVEDYKAKAEAYKAEAQAYVDKAKEYKSQVEDGIEQAKEYKAQAEDAIDTAKNAGSIAKGMAAGVTDKVSGAVDSAKAKAGIPSGDSGAAADSASENGSVEVAAGQPSAEKAVNLVDTPAATPTRRAIGSTASVNAVATSANTSAPAGTMPEAALSPAASNPLQSAAMSQTVDTVAVADGSVLAANAQAIATPSLSEAAIAETTTLSGSNLQSESLAAEPLRNKIDETSAAMPAKTLPLLNKVERQAGLSSADAVKAGNLVATDNLTAVKNEATIGDKISVKQSAAELKAVKPAVKNLNAQPATSLQPVGETAAEPKTSRPTRAIFKSSSGYGTIHTTYELGFASLTSSMKSGTTEDNMLIVPESLGLYCNLDYASAAEKGAMDACLKKINAIRYSTQDEATATEISNARKDIQNGYVEYLAAAYFEAMDIYNESLTFKNKVVDPVITSETPDVRAAWIYAKEMNQIVGTRINVLNKLWSRSLGVKAFGAYATEGFRDSEDEATVSK